jgi:vesicle coat complex subunit
MRAEMRGRLTVLGGVLIVAAVVAALVGASVFGQRKALATLDDPNPAVRLAAVRAMSREGNIVPLLKALHDEDADVRLVAVQRLGGPGRNGDTRARALIEALRDPHKGVRREAAEALYFTGSEAVPLLVEALKNPDPHVRGGAALALSDVAAPKDGRPRSTEEANLVIPALEKLTQDEDAEVRRNAEQALHDIRNHLRGRDP